MSDSTALGITEFRWSETKVQAAQLIAFGQSYSEIGAILGVSPNTVTAWNKHPVFAAEVTVMSGLVGMAIATNRMKVINRVLSRLLKNPDTRDLPEIRKWLGEARTESDRLNKGLNLDDDVIAILTSTRISEDSPI